MINAYFFYLFYHFCINESIKIHFPQLKVRFYMYILHNYFLNLQITRFITFDEIQSICKIYSENQYTNDTSNSKCTWMQFIFFRINLIIRRLISRMNCRNCLIILITNSCLLQKSFSSFFSFIQKNHAPYYILCNKERDYH